MFKFLNKHKYQQEQALTGNQICKLYYTLQSRYDGISSNIAILLDEDKYKKQINTYKKLMNYHLGDKLIEKENKCTFIIGGRETTLVFIKDLSEIETNKLYYKKYM